MAYWNTFDVELFNSSHDGDLDGVMAALAKGGKVNDKSAEGATPLIVAAQKGHTDICGVLLAHGGNVNDQTSGPGGVTPLIVAAENGHAGICGLLLAYGSNVNGIRPDIKRTPLHYAAQRGHVAVVIPVA